MILRFPLVAKKRRLGFMCGMIVPLAVSLRGFAVAVGLVGLAGCAVGPDGQIVTIVDDARVLMMSEEGLDEVERRQLERIQRYASMRAQAAGGGAFAGAVSAYFLAGQDGRAAAAGALAGAQLGFMAGAYVAKLNESAEDRRGDLNVQLAAAEAAVTDTRAAVRDNRDIVDAATRQIDDLNKRLQAGAITQEQYRLEIGNLDKRLMIVKESLRVAENEVRAIETTMDAQKESNPDGAKQLGAKRDAIQQEVAALREDHLRLIDAVGSIPPEIGAPATV